MPEAIITYDLRQGSKDSQQYYKTIEKLAMITKKRIKANLKNIKKNQKRYLMIV